MIDSVEQKTCLTCKETKGFHEFGSDKSKKDGKCIYCLVCRRALEARYRQTPKGKMRPSKERTKNYVLRNTYGISLARYHEVLNSQNGVCAICKSPPKTLHLSVDHCHETGIVRGILCYRCNTGLGNFKDDLELLKRAVKYLETATDLRN